MNRKQMTQRLLIIIFPLIATTSFSQTAVNFVVDSSQSSFVLIMSSNVTFLNSTFSDTDSDTASITGTVQVDLTPSTSPFSQIQITGLTLNLAEDVKLINQVGALGTVQVDVQMDSLSLVLVNPGAAAAVNAGAFTQPGNEMSIIGVYQLTGSGLIEAAAATLNTLINNDFGNFMLTDVGLGGMVTQENSTLRLDIPINVAAVTDFNESVYSGDVGFGVVGTVVATAEVATAVTEETTNLPRSFELHQNYPNPFNPSTTLSYRLATASDVSLTIYDLHGAEIRGLIDATQPAGMGSVVWDGRDNSGSTVASGIYLVKMVTADFAAQRKLMLLR